MRKKVFLINKSAEIIELENIVDSLLENQESVEAAFYFIGPTDIEIILGAKKIKIDFKEYSTRYRWHSKFKIKKENYCFYYDGVDENGLRLRRI